MISIVCPRKHFLGVPVAPPQDDRIPSHLQVCPSVPALGIDFFLQRPSVSSFCALRISVYPLMQLSKEPCHVGLCWVVIPLLEKKSGVKQCHLLPAGHLVGQPHFSTCQLLVLCWSWSQCSTLAKPVPLWALISATVMFCLAQAMMSGSLIND